MGKDKFHVNVVGESTPERYRIFDSWLNFGKSSVTSILASRLPLAT